jgi:hypothetical protein
MARVLDPDLQDLIDTGHYESHTAVVITLGDAGETELHLATAEFSVGAQPFLAQLGENSPLKMSLTNATDRTGLKAQNVDGVIGQQLTGLPGALDGATAVLGMAFQDQQRLGPIFYDEKLPGDLLAGAVDKEWAEFAFVADIYGGQVVGETVSSVFPYQDNSRPIGSGPDPDDLPDRGDPDGPPGRGRIPIGTGFIPV